MSPTNSRSNTGFTLVEVLVIAPMVMLIIGGFIALMVSMVGDVLITRDRNIMVYDSLSALGRIENDVRLGAEFSATTGSLSSPQGSNNNFTGTAAFTNSNDTLILQTLATDKNPLDTTRQLVYYANQPNACGDSETTNEPFIVTVVYFIKDGSLWRRSILPQYDAGELCATPWQRNSCSPGYTASRCQANDVKLMDNVAGLDVEYFETPGSTTPMNASDAETASTIKVTINGQRTTAGREFSTSESVRATKLNGISSTTGSSGGDS